MSTPVATIADALFAFIMSLLRDPEAAAAFNAAPHAALTHNGLGDACAADVRAVKPVVVDHASVSSRPLQHQSSGTPQQQSYPPTDQHSADPDPVVREISRIINQFTSIDARSTIVDQSVNQNIWTEGGDVTQTFDQAAVVASGDEAIAAGDDANLIDSDVDITVGDVSVGNTTNDGSFNTDNSDNSAIDGSFNGTDIDISTGTDADAATLTAADADAPAESDAPSDAATIAGNAVAAAVDAATDAVDDAGSAVAEALPEAPAEQPADLLSGDLTSTEDTTYDSDAASTLIDEPLIEDPAEEQ